MDKEEITLKLKEITKQLAELTTEVCKCEETLAARLSIEIINIAGDASVSLDMQTGGDMGEVKAGIEAMRKYREDKSLKPQDALAQAEELMRSLGTKKEPPAPDNPPKEEPK